MKLKNGFVTHEMGGEQIMVATGEANFAGMIRSNATAAFVVDCLKNPVTKDEILDAILAKYDVSREVAEADVDKILEKLRSVGALDE